jgi:hypothetical protein
MQRRDSLEPLKVLTVSLSDVVVQRGVDFLPSRRTGMVFRANECLRVNTLGVGSSPSRFA